MDDIFRNAKSILVVWTDLTAPDILSTFQEIIQTKSKHAQIAFENVQILLESRRATSSFDIILFNLTNETNTSINVNRGNELFRLLHPNGYLLAHIEHTQQTQTLNIFKMCGFSSCNPLDTNSSFLIENKSDDVKKLGSLWLCQKPSFDVGHSVPLLRTGVRLSRQISTTGGGRKTWTVENDDDDEDDFIDTNELHDDHDRKKPNVQNYDCGTTSSDVRKTCKDCTCGLAHELKQNEHVSARQNVKSSCGSCYLGDAFRCVSCPSRGSPTFKPGERMTVVQMSDV